MGIVAAYLFLYHNQRIRSLLMLAILPVPITLHMTAWVFILYTFLKDMARGWLQKAGAIESIVDSFTHLGGLIAGLTSGLTIAIVTNLSPLLLGPAPYPEEWQWAVAPVPDLRPAWLVLPLLASTLIAVTLFITRHADRLRGR